MKTVFKQFVYFAAVLSLFLCFISAAYPLVLDVPERFQEQTQWCWAGVSEALLEYYGTSITQCTMANFARQNNSWGSDDCCSNPSGGICNQPNWMWGTSGSLQAILSNWGVNSTPYSRELYQSEVESEISDCRPFIIRWGWSSGGGHFLAGRGIEGNTVHYMDPWFGNGYSTGSYSWVVSGSSHTWTHSLTVTTLHECGNPPEFVSPEEGAVLDNGCADRSDNIVWDFSWMGVAGAAKYHLYVEHPGAAIAVINDSNIVATNYHHDCPGCYIADVNRFGWEWKLRAYANGTWTGWSDTRTFDVEPLNTDCQGPAIINAMILPSTWDCEWADNPNGTVRVILYNFPTSYTNTDIDDGTVLLNNTLPAIGGNLMMRPSYPGIIGPVAIGGFMRQSAVISLDYEYAGNYTCRITGQFVDGRLFEARTDIYLDCVGAPELPPIIIIIIGGPKTAVSADIPKTYQISQNYPNPFNSQTAFEYALPQDGYVTLDIFDILGRKIATLVNEQMPAGYHSVSWNAGSVPSGIYFYKIQAGDFVETKKMSVIK